MNNYRNNTIGLESDVAGLTVEDARSFYKKHYIPANAVLAIVGDVETREANRLVDLIFVASRARHAAAKLVARATQWRTADPAPWPDRQAIFYPRFPTGRIQPDVPAFLVMQQLLGAGSGFNFNQNDEALRRSRSSSTASPTTSRHG